MDALVVLDMQHDFLHPEGVYAKHGLALPGTETLVGRVCEAMAAALAAGRPVIATTFVIHQAPTGERWVSGYLGQARPFLAHEGFAPGTRGAGLPDGLPQPHYVIEKYAFNAFHGTPLEWFIRKLAVQHLVLCGITTPAAVESTAREALARDLTVTVLADATAAFSAAEHEGALDRLRAFCEVTTTAEVVARWRGARG